MRRLLGALRADDLPTEPQPGLASLDRLASQATAAGVPVELRVEGPSRPLPAGLEVSAYRIAQEALTNTIKHAPGGRARLTVRYRPHTSSWRWSTAAAARPRPRRTATPATACEGCASGSPCTAACSRPGLGRRVPGAGCLPHRPAMSDSPGPEGSGEPQGVPR